jgi:anti-sigma factor RsiW
MDLPYEPDNVPLRSASRAQCPPADVIIDYVANDLTLTVRRRVDTHMTTCKHCAVEVKAIRAAFEAKFGSSSANTAPGGAE